MDPGLSASNDRPQGAIVLRKKRPLPIIPGEYLHRRPAHLRDPAAIAPTVVKPAERRALYHKAKPVLEHRLKVVERELAAMVIKHTALRLGVVLTPNVKTEDLWPGAHQRLATFIGKWVAAAQQKLGRAAPDGRPPAVNPNDEGRVLATHAALLEFFSGSSVPDLKAPDGRRRLLELVNQILEKFGAPRPLDQDDVDVLAARRGCRVRAALATAQAHGISLRKVQQLLSSTPV